MVAFSVLLFVFCLFFCSFFFFFFFSFFFFFFFFFGFLWFFFSFSFCLQISLVWVVAGFFGGVVRVIARWTVVEDGWRRATSPSTSAREDKGPPPIPSLLHAGPLPAHFSICFYSPRGGPFPPTRAALRDHARECHTSHTSGMGTPFRCSAACRRAASPIGRGRRGESLCETEWSDWLACVIMKSVPRQNLFN